MVVEDAVVVVDDAVGVLVDVYAFEGIAVGVIYLLVYPVGVRSLAYDLLLDVHAADVAGGHVGAFGQTGDLVAVPCEVEVRVPCEVAGHDGTRVDVELYTGVGEVAEVDVADVREVGTCGIVGPYEQVGRLAAVPVEATVDAVVEESEVDADVPCVGFLPLQVSIVLLGICYLYVVGSTVGVDADGIGVRLVGEDVVDGEIGEVVAAKVLLAGDTVLGAELEFAQHAACAFHEVFLKYLPAEGHGGECAPAVVLAEARRTVPAHGGCEEVAVLQGVVDTAEERHELIAALVVGLGRVLVAGILADRLVGGIGDAGVNLAVVVAREVEALPVVAGGHIEVRLDGFERLVVVEIEREE